MSICGCSRNPTNIDCCVTDPVDCAIVSDNFNRADSSDPGKKWCEISGEWIIESNKLKCVSEGILLTKSRQPPSSRVNRDYSIKIRFRLVDLSSTNAVAKIICGYTDEDNFYWVRVDFDAGAGSVTPSFYRRVAGVDTIILDPADYPGGHSFPVEVDNSFLGKICYSDADWTFDSGTSYESGTGLIPNESSETQWTVTGSYGQAELPIQWGMVGLLLGRFDDWEFNQHWESHSNCDGCSCICLNEDDIDQYIQLPEVLTATIVPIGDSNDCDIDFSEHVLIQGTVVSSIHQLSPTKKFWTTENWVGFGTPTEIEMQFQCHSSFGNNSQRLSLALRMPAMNSTYYWGTVGPPGPPTAYIDWSESTCDPLHLVFKTLTGALGTCDLGGSTGITNTVCPEIGCFVHNSTNAEMLLALAWKIVITE